MTSAVRFIEDLPRYASRVALVDDGQQYSYADICDVINTTTRQWQSLTSLRRPLILLECRQTATTVLHYLTCLANNWPVMLINEQLGETAREDIVTRFQPSLMVTDDDIQSLSDKQHEMDSQLAVLLSTSGSTGGGKWVAISAENINANTQSILDYLPITVDDNALATLPFSYSYGLSVLHTHLAAGACLTLTRLTAMDRGFWSLLNESGITSLSGVPHWYEMLARLRFTRHELPHLRYFTQAGGRLSERFIKEFANYADNTDKHFYVMYGQTEATARMAYLSPDKVGRKPQSIGQPVPGGRFAIFDEQGQDITETGEQGEIGYQGDNIMLGYVSGADELGSFTQNSWLYTGDIGFRDADGDYVITGRKSRFIKIYAERVNLDGLESLMAQHQQDVKCLGSDNQLKVACLEGDKSAVESSLRQLVSVPPKAVTVFEVPEWPQLNNGKTDYRSLEALAQHL